MRFQQTPHQILTQAVAHNRLPVPEVSCLRHIAQYPPRYRMTRQQKQLPQKERIEQTVP
jgi:hypothetical protein